MDIDSKEGIMIDLSKMGELSDEEFMDALKSTGIVMSDSATGVFTSGSSAGSPIAPIILGSSGAGGIGTITTTPWVHGIDPIDPFDPKAKPSWDVGWLSNQDKIEFVKSVLKGLSATASSIFNENIRLDLSITQVFNEKIDRVEYLAKLELYKNEFLISDQLVVNRSEDKHTLLVRFLETIAFFGLNDAISNLIDKESVGL